MELSRRKLVLGLAPAAALTMVAGCTPAEIATAQQNWANFVDQVNAIVASGCNGLVPSFIATANTIDAIVAVLYPSVGAAIAAGINAVETVANAICNAVPKSPPAQAALRRRLLGSTRTVPIVIGTTVVTAPNGVSQPIQVVGYH